MSEEVVDKDLDYSNKERLDIATQEIEFEAAFYTAIAGNKNYEVIPTMAVDANEKFMLAAFAQKNGATIIFQANLGKTGIIFSVDTGKVGIYNALNINGFYC